MATTHAELIATLAGPVTLGAPVAVVTVGALAARPTGPVFRALYAPALALRVQHSTTSPARLRLIDPEGAYLAVVAEPARAATQEEAACVTLDLEVLRVALVVDAQGYGAAVVVDAAALTLYPVSPR